MKLLLQRFCFQHLEIDFFFHYTLTSYIQHIHQDLQFGSIDFSGSPTSTTTLIPIRAKSNLLFKMAMKNDINWP